MLCARGADDARVGARREIAASTGVEVRAVVADLSDAEQIERVAARGAERNSDSVDILVTNAGGPPAGAFEKHDWDAWQRAVNLTLRSAVELTRAVLPGMRERKWGRIINVTSIAVKQPVDNLILSNSVRSAVTGFARTLANEVATDGITVNNILPGYTRTERVEAARRRRPRRKEGVDRARHSSRASRRRFRWSGSASRASSPRSPRSSRRSGRATSPGSRSRWTAAGFAHCCSRDSRLVWPRDSRRIGLQPVGHG